MARDEIQQRVEEELPVVARLVIEIRSDGSRTVAAGLTFPGLAENLNINNNKLK